jgi:hypothetical protein
MTDLIFDPPWYLPLGIAALGIYLFVHGNRRQLAQVRAAGLGVLALAVALFLAGRFLDTDQEKAEKGTRALIDSVEKHDWNKMRSLLDPSASVSTPRGPVYSNRDLIIGGAQAATRAVRREQHPYAIDAEQAGCVRGRYRRHRRAQRPEVHRPDVPDELAVRVARVF